MTTWLEVRSRERAETAARQRDLDAIAALPPHVTAVLEMLSAPPYSGVSIVPYWSDEDRRVRLIVWLNSPYRLPPESECADIRRLIEEATQTTIWHKQDSVVASQRPGDEGPCPYRGETLRWHDVWFLAWRPGLWAGCRLEKHDFDPTGGSFYTVVCKPNKAE